MKVFIICSCLCFFILGCNYSVIMTATHGTASDVVDETDTNSPTIDASVPLTVP